MDTLVPDFHVKPDPELDLLLAGRQRCYFHAIDDPTCEENVWHARSWEQWAASIPKRELDVFEYYTDMLLRVVNTEIKMALPHLSGTRCRL
jgi:hypothetical protein